MKFKPYKQSKFKKADDLYFKYLVKKRGHICEIHNKECPGIGPCHILSKATAPRLRYDDMNVILSGWFCAHYYLHHDADHPKAVYAKKRICELRGYESWEILRDDLKLRNHISPKIDLKMMELFLTKELAKEDL